MMPTEGYKLVELPNGDRAVYSAAYREAMHPGLGPAAEGETLYVRQLKIRERMREGVGAFVVWDVGLGAAANAIAVLRGTRDIAGPLRLMSFDDTAEPLSFALENTQALGYLGGYEAQAKGLLDHGQVQFRDAAHEVDWQFHLGDFPLCLARVAAGVPPAVEPGFQPGGTSAGNESRLEPSVTDPGGKMPASTSGRMPDATPPHAILFDAFSPAKNPAMWTLPLFTNLFRLLNPARPCNLTTYSRSTMFRVTLLLAGFFVGRGVPTGLKEETTVAANILELIDAPLDRQWLERARRSGCAEPLREPVYSQRKLSAATWEKLQAHPQFH
jgi:hypothetical protein